MLIRKHSYLSIDVIPFQRKKFDSAGYSGTINGFHFKQQTGVREG